MNKRNFQKFGCGYFPVKTAETQIAEVTIWVRTQFSWTMLRSTYMYSNSTIVRFGLLELVLWNEYRCRCGWRGSGMQKTWTTSVRTKRISILGYKEGFLEIYGRPTAVQRKFNGQLILMAVVVFCWVGEGEGREHSETKWQRKLFVPNGFTSRAKLNEIRINDTSDRSNCNAMLPKILRKLYVFYLCAEPGIRRPDVRHGFGRILHSETGFSRDFFSVFDCQRSKTLSSLEMYFWKVPYLRNIVTAG